MDNTNTSTIQFTESEMSDIKRLTEQFQSNVFKFGQLYLEKMDLDKKFQSITSKEQDLQKEYQNLAQTEQKLLDSLLNKYGEGQLDMKNGVFIPVSKK